MFRQKTLRHSRNDDAIVGILMLMENIDSKNLIPCDFPKDILQYQHEKLSCFNANVNIQYPSLLESSVSVMIFEN
jgi:hypothetical protein